MPLARFDLHLHTEFSPDCDTDLGRIEPHCQSVGVTGIAVTDHNTIEGALRMRDRARSLHIIVGEEVSTCDGDVIGLFLKEHIAPRMSALETMEAISAQGGLVYLPHPFDKSKARRTKGASLQSVLTAIDIVETFNGKVGRDQYNMLALDFARHHHKVFGGGSDAHNLHAIGTVVNDIDTEEDLNDPAAFLRALKHAQILGHRRSPIGGWLVRGRRPLSLAWRRIRGETHRD